MELPEVLELIQSSVEPGDQTLRGDVLTVYREGRNRAGGRVNTKCTVSLDASTKQVTSAHYTEERISLIE
jgi:hypothetical protein